MPDLPPITTCPILHSDRFIIVVDKPDGVLSHPNPTASGKPQRAAFAGRYDLDAKRFYGPAGEVFLIHRLDQDTSGVLLGTHSEVMAERCRSAFEAGQVKKRYLALVAGLPKPEGTWLDHLAVNRERNQVRTIVNPKATPNAELRYRVISSSAQHRVSLIEIDLITGRTHQIRVQSASRKHPVLGDDVYGDFDLNKRLRRDHNLRRLFLHARQLEFKHPASGQMLCVQAPLPEELAGVLQSLGLEENDE